VAGDAEVRAGPAETRVRGLLSAAILDVDGVLLPSPHEQAWREALIGLADPARFTTALYQAKVAGKPRMDGATAALQALGVADAVRLAPAYAAAKQRKLESLIAAGGVPAFPDALRFVKALAVLGWPLAVASSSKNADAMMRAVPTAAGRSLIDMFVANDCGCDFAHGKPDPEIFLNAAKALGVAPCKCVVVEDAPAGVEAARGSATPRDCGPQAPISSSRAWTRYRSTPLSAGAFRE
jgi:beta-phosphoglucomutase